MLGTIQKAKGIEQGWTGYSGFNQKPSRAKRKGRGENLKPVLELTL
jgi:hypothetical protein